MTPEQRELYYRRWLERYQRSFDRLLHNPEAMEIYFIGSLEDIAPNGLEAHKFVSAEEDLISLRALINAYKQSIEKSPG